MTRKEEAADCRRKARLALKAAYFDGRVWEWWFISSSYLNLAEALEMECQVRDVVVGDRRAA